MLLPRPTVLNKYCLSTKLRFLWYFYMCFSYHDWLLTSFSLINDFATSHSNDFILYCTYLSNESCLENDFFLKKLEWKNLLYIRGITFKKLFLKFFCFFLTFFFSQSCFDLVFIILIYKYLCMFLMGRQNCEILLW